VARRAPAPFTPADFAAQTADWVAPVRTSWAGVEVYELPPNSRGHLVLDMVRRLEPLDGLSPDDAAFHARLIAAAYPVVRGGDTVYLVVVDEQGMAVSLNQSLFRAFGSGVVVPGTGVLLHNRGSFHTPASYRGGAKPIHTLCPGMVLRDGRPELVFGTMGGEGQVQIHLQLLARMLAAGQAPQDAVAGPRWILEQDTLLVEDGLPSLDGLLPPGVTTSPMPVRDLAGHAHAIRFIPGGLDCGCDPRSDGVVVGD
jgi:gamma-glutamyltranspeptidase/glutathione hydrolase